MLHVYKDDITTSVTLSDTVTWAKDPCSIDSKVFSFMLLLTYFQNLGLNGLWLCWTSSAETAQVFLNRLAEMRAKLVLLTPALD